MSTDTILGASRSTRPTRTGAHGVAAGRILLAVGLLYLVGSLIDVGILWVLQRQPSPTWEFVAIGSTLDAFPRFGLAFALIVAGAWIGGGRGSWLVRISGLGLLLAGLFAAGLVALLVTDYFALLSGGVGEQAVPMIRATTVKGGLIGGLSFLLYAIVGVLALRDPGGAR